MLLQNYEKKTMKTFISDIIDRYLNTTPEKIQYLHCLNLQRAEKAVHLIHFLHHYHHHLYNHTHLFLDVDALF